LGDCCEAERGCGFPEVLYLEALDHEVNLNLTGSYTHEMGPDSCLSSAFVVAMPGS